MSNEKLKTNCTCWLNVGSVTACGSLQAVNYNGKIYTVQYIDVFSGDEIISYGMTEDQVRELLRDQDVYLSLIHI